MCMQVNAKIDIELEYKSGGWPPLVVCAHWRLYATMNYTTIASDNG